MVTIKVFQKYAFEFDGQNDYIDFGDISDFEIIHSMSIVVWVKFNSLKWVNSIVSKGDESKNNLFWLFRGDKTDQNEWEFEFGPGFSRYSLKVCDNVDVGTWYFVVATFNEGVSRLYIDGTLFADIDSSLSVIDTGTYRFVIGRYSPGNSHFLHGCIGEVRIYDRPLNEVEIQYLYKGGHIEDGLVFWLYPDEESVVLDSDGETVLKVYDRVNGYEGTAYNGVRLVDGKDVDVTDSQGKRFLIVCKV